ncbi:cyclase family protein [Gulosibacter faecalis]|uniref:Cyclase family protein n=1 Tax=Gulosibacter faecalis TaxID=272240 RepID=A0ABW5V073_9MICO|nr:cyclase family protein [Gulosibacter faecalis]
MFVDLAHPLRSGMPVFPGDPAVAVRPAAELERDGFAVARLELGSHSGTHVDAPAHSIAGGRTIDAVGLDELVGDAVVVQLPGLAPREVISRARLAPLLDAGLGGARIVLLATGWDTRWGTPDYFAHPTLDPDACRALLDAGMHVLGVDTLNPDPSDGADLPVHGAVLGGDHLIVENLRRLTELPARVRFAGVPLRIAEGDGSPIRAYAEVEYSCCPVSQK